MPLPIRPAVLPPGPLRPHDQGKGSFGEPSTFIKVFLGAFRRDIQSLYPVCRIETCRIPDTENNAAMALAHAPKVGLNFDLLQENDDPRGALRVSLFGATYRLIPSRHLGLGRQDRKLIRAMGAVLDLNFQILFRGSRMSILQLRRGMPEDHYIAAYLEPAAYTTDASAPSRIAEAILTLRTMALSTYENRRVTTGALILMPGAEDVPVLSHRLDPPECLSFSVELTGLKSLQRLCDGRRTLFLVDERGSLADIVDIRHWAATRTTMRVEAAGEVEETSDSDSPMLTVPCARVFTPHAQATITGGHVCLVLSPNQEIKVFAGGVQAFVFAHGRWRVLDPVSKFGLWEQAVANPALARVLFQTALDLVEERQGGLVVVVGDPELAIGRLIAPHDLLDSGTRPAGPGTSGIDPIAEPVLSIFAGSPELGADGSLEPSAAALDLAPSDGQPDKRSLHYLARGRNVNSLDPAVLEALASLDGALVTDASGRLLAFGAILRHDAPSLAPTADLASSTPIEGARTTAALVASRFGPVLKISEDGIVSFFLDGARVWDL